MSYKATLARRARSKGEFTGKHLVSIEYCYKSKQVLYPIGDVYCAPKDWSAKTGAIINGYDRKTMNDLNDIIDAAKEKMSNIIRYARSNDHEPSHEYVKMMWEKPIIENKKKIEDLLPLFEEWAKGKVVEREKKAKGNNGKVSQKELQTLPYLKEFAEIRGGFENGICIKSWSMLCKCRMK